MMRRMRELEVRREALQVRSCAQRAAIERGSLALAERLSWADRFAGAAQALAKRPLLTGAAALGGFLLASRSGLLRRLAKAAVLIGVTRRVTALFREN